MTSQNPRGGGNPPLSEQRRFLGEPGASLAGQAETTGTVLREIVPPGHRCGPVEATAEQFARLEAAIEREDKAQAERMPDEQAALRQMQDAYTRLQRLGWSDAIYCPKDGSAFLIVEAGSTGTFTAHYEGDWPRGSWWVRDGGDLWPSRPILWKPRP